MNLELVVKNESEILAFTTIGKKHFTRTQCLYHNGWFCISQENEPVRQLEKWTSTKPWNRLNKKDTAKFHIPYTNSTLLGRASAERIIRILNKTIPLNI